MIKRYTKGELTVIWEPGKCIHSGKCVQGLPTVFDLKSKPWIQLDGATAEEIIAQVAVCPSKALRIAGEEEPAGITTPYAFIDFLTDGPLMICGNFEVETTIKDFSLTAPSVSLCRCGRSGRKPLCDGSHARVGFIG